MTTRLAGKKTSLAEIRNAKTVAGLRRTQRVASHHTKRRVMSDAEDCDACHDGCLIDGLGCIGISIIVGCAPCGVACVVIQVACELNCNRTTACKNKIAAEQNDR